MQTCVIRTGRGDAVCAHGARLFVVATSAALCIALNAVRCILGRTWHASGSCDNAASADRAKIPNPQPNTLLSLSRPCDQRIRWHSLHFDLWLTPWLCLLDAHPLALCCSSTGSINDAIPICGSGLHSGRDACAACGRQCSNRSVFAKQSYDSLNSLVSPCLRQTRRLLIRPFDVHHSGSNIDQGCH
jgi:hypothetical protein